MNLKLIEKYGPRCPQYIFSFDIIMNYFQKLFFRPFKPKIWFLNFGFFWSFRFFKYQYGESHLVGDSIMR